MYDFLRYGYTSFAYTFAAVWGYFWIKESYIACQVTLIFNTSIHLYAVYALPNPLHNVSQENKNLRTHLLSKTSTGLAILYMWKTWGIVDVSSPIVDAVVIHLCGAENDGTVGIRAASNNRLLSIAGAYI